MGRKVDRLLTTAYTKNVCYSQPSIQAQISQTQAVQAQHTFVSDHLNMFLKQHICFLVCTMPHVPDLNV